MKKEVFRIGDIVRIKNPQRFIRCGYPLGLKEGYKFVNENEEKVSKFLDELFEAKNPSRLLLEPVCRHISNDLKKALAYEYISSKGFGGTKREIYEEYYETFEKSPEYWKIIDKKIVRTGYREVESDYDDWSERGYTYTVFCHEKSYVVLTVEYVQYDIYDPFSIKWIETLEPELRICAHHCEKVNIEFEKEKVKNENKK